jgi:antitoxin MazE
MRVILRVRRKGVIILPKKLREALGIEEGDQLIADIRDNVLILRPLKPRVVDVDPSLIDELLEEEARLEGL